MSLIDQQKDLENFSDQALLQEATQPQFGYPPYLVTAEIQRRQQDRARVQQQTMAAQGEAPPVAQQQVAQFANQMAPMAQPEPVMGGMPPEAGMGMAGSMAGSMPSPEPVGIMGAAPVQAMAGGGEVKRMQDGRGVSTAERNKLLFIQNFYPQAKKVADQLNIPVDAVLAQAALESGYGKRYKGSNLFGIKADPSWKGDTIDFTTQEVRDGKRGKETGTFRRYSTTDQSFSDYADFLK
jgi:flagellum-specific peptidoglycan hydrolase FlgJ